MPKTEKEKIQKIIEIIEAWPKDCPNRPTLAQALMDPGILHSDLGDPGIATLTNGTLTVELYHVESPREVLPTKLGEHEIFGKHGDIFQYGGDKSDRLELEGFIDAQSEYDAIKTTLKTMRQGQGTSPISVTVRFGANPYINAVQYWVGDVELKPKPGHGLFVADYSIPFVKRD